MIRVQAPDGTVVQFPDGTPFSTIDGVMRSHFVQTPAVKAVGDAKAALMRGGEGDAALQMANGYTFGHIPQIDAAGQALKTGILNLVGKGPGYGMADAYAARKGVEQRVLDRFSAAHPVAGLGLNIFGGAVNPVSLAGGEWINGARTLPMAIARSSAVGAGEGFVAGGPKGAAVGALTGPLIPIASGAAGAAASMAGNVGRNVYRMVGMAEPGSVAQRRLAAAMARDVKAGIDPLANLSTWPGVSDPTLADVGGENVRAEIRNAGTQGPARTTLARYKNRVAADLQGNALDLTGKLPGPAVTAPAARQGAQEALDAATGYTPRVEPGSGGAALSQALNERADAARQAVDAAYATARAAGPEKAQLQSRALPAITAAVRDAISDYSPKDIPRVSGNVSDLDSLSTPTARDLFETRSRLANLRASNDPVEAGAAGKAVKALDAQIDQADQSNLFTGDPQAVALWKDAIAHRRVFGQMFQGNDLIHALTDQDLRGGARNLVIAPEDATNVILGRSGVAPKANLARDFSRVTDMLGEDHPAVQAFRSEATDRLLGADAGTPNYGTTLQRFTQQNPDLGKLLVPQDVLDDVAARQLRIAHAAGDRGAVDTGSGILTTPPDAYVPAIPSDRIPMVQVGGRQALVDKIGAPTEGAIGALNTISTATNAGKNLSATFGEDEADTYRRGLQAEVDRMENANWMAPQLGAKTFGSAQDAGHASLMHLPALALNLAKTALGGGPLSDAERVAIVDPGIGKLSPEMLATLAKLHSTRPFIPGTGFLVGPVASTGAQSAQ